MYLLGLMERRLSASQRGILYIFGGTAAGQALALVSAPLLSRLYTPSDFGSFAVLSALIVTLGTVSASRLDLAIPLPAREREAQSLVAIGLWSALGFALVGTAVVGAFGDDVAAAFHQPQLMPWLWIVPAAGSVMSSYLVLNQLAIRHRRFGSIGRRNFLQSTSMVLAQVGAGTAGLRPGGLVLGLSLGQLFGALSLTAGSRLRSGDARQGRRAANMRAVLSRYRRFPLLLAPSGLLNVLGLQLPVILIAYWYGSEVAGWLGLTQRVLALPVTLLGTAVAQVYLAELTRAVRGDFDRAQRLFRRVTRTLLVVAVALMLVLIVLGPWLFSLVFGSNWHESGEYASALSLGLAGQMVGSTLSQTLVALERQGLQLAWDAMRVVSTSAVVAVAVWAGASALTTIWLVGGLSAALYGLSWYLSYRCLNIAAATNSTTQGTQNDPPDPLGVV
jgi:O-antigen/teichoic acid export membrane protein